MRLRPITHHPLLLPQQPSRPQSTQRAAPTLRGGQSHTWKKRTWQEQNYLLKGPTAKPTGPLESSSPPRTSRPHPSLASLAASSVRRISVLILLRLDQIFFKHFLHVWHHELNDALCFGHQSLCEHGTLGSSVRTRRPSSTSAPSPQLGLLAPNPGPVTPESSTRPHKLPKLLAVLKLGDVFRWLKENQDQSGAKFQSSLTESVSSKRPLSPKLMLIQRHSSWDTLARASHRARCSVL